MSAMASQITSLMIVYPTDYSGIDQRKRQSSATLAFVLGIHRSPVNSPRNGPVTRKMLPFDDVIMCLTFFQGVYNNRTSYWQNKQNPNRMLYTIIFFKQMWKWWKLLYDPRDVFFSHLGDVPWALGRPISSTTRLFLQMSIQADDRESIGARYHWSLCCEFNGTRSL